MYRLGMRMIFFVCLLKCQKCFPQESKETPISLENASFNIIVCWGFRCVGIFQYRYPPLFLRFAQKKKKRDSYIRFSKNKNKKSWAAFGALKEQYL